MTSPGTYKLLPPSDYGANPDWSAGNWFSREGRAENKAARAERALEKGKEEKAAKLAGKSELLQATMVKRGKTSAERKTLRARYSKLVYENYRKKKFKQAQANLVYATNNGASLSRVKNDWDKKFEKGKKRDAWDNFIDRGKNYCPAVNRRRNIAINAITIVVAVGATVATGGLAGGAAIGVAASGGSVAGALTVGVAVGAATGAAAGMAVKGTAMAVRGGGLQKTAVASAQEAKTKSSDIKQGAEKYTKDTRSALAGRPVKAKQASRGQAAEEEEELLPEEEEFVFPEEEGGSSAVVWTLGSLLVLSAIGGGYLIYKKRKED